jgi:hypothetical protein
VCKKFEYFPSGAAYKKSRLNAWISFCITVKEGIEKLLGVGPQVGSIFLPSLLNNP